MEKQLELNIKTEMSQEYLDVRNLIRNSKNAISRKQIALALGKDKSSYRKINIIIHDLITIHREPIGCASRKFRKGYFYCDNEYDFAMNEQSLTSRIEKMLHRREVMRELKKEILNK